MRLGILFLVFDTRKSFEAAIKKVIIQHRHNSALSYQKRSQPLQIEGWQFTLYPK